MTTKDDIARFTQSIAQLGQGFSQMTKGVSEYELALAKQQYDMETEKKKNELLAQETRVKLDLYEKQAAELVQKALPADAAQALSILKGNVPSGQISPQTVDLVGKIGGSMNNAMAQYKGLSDIQTKEIERLNLLLKAQSEGKNIELGADKTNIESVQKSAQSGREAFMETHGIGAKTISEAILKKNNFIKDFVVAPSIGTSNQVDPQKAKERYNQIIAAHSGFTPSHPNDVAEANKIIGNYAAGKYASLEDASNDLKKLSQKGVPQSKISTTVDLSSSNVTPAGTTTTTLKTTPTGGTVSSTTVPTQKEVDDLSATVRKYIKKGKLTKDEEKELGGAIERLKEIKASMPK